ncbi:NUDIX hydrolase [Yasminevirus sp. GU-2018]|uniref:NUDIX hydrolase n=1 Tax=Yasminevirus sp. GU-2018 TaxID=2420051 RepID=A0A5K0UAX8_9VIRU|nr:NUDIX hydrolase [Yasminevirus sp. GU-2018]
MGIFIENGGTYSGAGVLITEDYYKRDGTVEPCILLVRNSASMLYTDFGGTYEKKYGSLQALASAELREESRNLINVAPKHLVKCVDIPAGQHFYRAYTVKVNGISRKYFLHNKNKLDGAHAQGVYVSRCWRETDKIAHIPIAGINFAQLGVRGGVNLTTVDGESVRIDGRAKSVIYHIQTTLNEMITKKPIGTRRDMKLNVTEDFKNDTYSFIIN